MNTNANKSRLKMEEAAQKLMMQKQTKDAIEAKVTPYYDVLNRCTKAVITELDSKETTVEVEEVRGFINFINGYATVIHKIISNPVVQEAIIDFVIQLEKPSAAAETKAKDKQEEEIEFCRS
jgi:hypothetical protein